MTRWQKFYLDDPSLGSISSSFCASQARETFAKYKKRLILDLGCGTGRDTICLAGDGAKVIGIDAARSGLVLAQKRTITAIREPYYIESIAQNLPFPDALFEGVYCFGLLHEFVGSSANGDVTRLMSEINRVLQRSGLVILTTLAGEPKKGLPHVQLFTEKMFDDATSMFECVEKKIYADVGCTGKVGYKVWYGEFTKPEP